MVKTYSTGAAWQEFGPDSTVVTPVKRTGEVADGTLTGDLVLVGKGDLTMGGRTKPDGTVDFTNLDHNDANGIPGATLTTEDPLTGLNELAAQVKAAGINTVSGDVIVDNRLWDAHTLAEEPITPIIINQNVIDLTDHAGRRGPAGDHRDVAGGGAVDRGHPGADGGGRHEGHRNQGELARRWQGRPHRHYHRRQRSGGEGLRVQGPGDICPHRVHRGPRPGRSDRHSGSGGDQPRCRAAGIGRRRCAHLGRRADVSAAARGSRPTSTRSVTTGVPKR